MLEPRAFPPIAAKKRYVNNYATETSKFAYIFEFFVQFSLFFKEHDPLMDKLVAVIMSSYCEHIFIDIVISAQVGLQSLVLLRVWSLFGLWPLLPPRLLVVIRLFPLFLFSLCFSPQLILLDFSFSLALPLR